MTNAQLPQVAMAAGIDYPATEFDGNRASGEYKLISQLFLSPIFLYVIVIVSMTF